MNKAFLLTCAFFGIICICSAQVDTIPSPPVDSAQVVTDTIPEQAKQKKERKKRDHFKIAAGVNFGSVDVSENGVEGTGGIGYLFGASYQRGRFFYWELGAQYNRLGITLTDGTTDNSFGIGSIDIPVSVGINILSATDRILGLRAFIGATPSIPFSVGDNDAGIESDDLNSFVAYAHGGVGVDIAFFYIEAIYKAGLGDMFEDIDSRPSQLQVLVGFRF